MAKLTTSEVFHLNLTVSAIHHQMEAPAADYLSLTAALLPYTGPWTAPTSVVVRGAFSISGPWTDVATLTAVGSVQEILFPYSHIQIEVLNHLDHNGELQLTVSYFTGETPDDGSRDVDITSSVPLDIASMPGLDILTMPVQDFMLEVPRGNVTSISSVNKFGQNPTSTAGTTEDVWGGGGTYSWPTTADITHLRQAVDQAAMRGQTIEIQGLDTNWDLAVQDVTLDAVNTTTPVVLATALRRVFRMKVMANVVANQDIELRNVGGGTTYAVITAGNNQTLMALYTVPADTTAYMTQYYVSVARSTANDPTGTDVTMWVADRANTYEFQLKHSIGMPSSTAPFIYTFRPYLKITEMSDIKISALCLTKAGDVHAGFDLLLVDN